MHTALAADLSRIANDREKALRQRITSLEEAAKTVTADNGDVSALREKLDAAQKTEAMLREQITALEAEATVLQRRSEEAAPQEASGAVDGAPGPASAIGHYLSKLMACTPSRYSGGYSGGRHSVLRTPGYTPDDAFSAEDAIPPLQFGGGSGGRALDFEAAVAPSAAEE